jgi:serine O-acetyltransferase
VGLVVGALRRARFVRSGGREPRRRDRPPRDAVIEILRDLRAALFPRHFGVSDCTEAGLDFFVGSRLDGGLRALQEQIRRCLQGSVCGCAAASATASEIAAEFARSLPRIRCILETDLRAALAGDPAASSRAEVLLCYPGVSAMVNHRLAHELYRLGVPLLPRMISELAHSLTGIDIHPGAQIGERFFIDHGTGVAIGETAVIGPRVRLYQGVTLGAIRFPVGPDGSLVKGQPRHPIIEEDVVIYAGATVLGRITVGRGATIGANVWVAQSVPPGSRITQAKVRQEGSFVGGAGI